MTPYLARKKEEKRQRLLESAHHLFVRSGISGTSISEICQEAGVAKGTFYLYFANKEEILKALNIQLSHDLLQDAYNYALEHNAGDFCENVILMAHRMIDRFRSDPDMVKLMKRDFHWPVTEESFMESDEPLIKTIREQIVAYSHGTGISTHALLIRFFSGIAMITSVCYSCLIDHQPCEIDSATTEFDPMIRAILKAPESRSEPSAA
jgi:AcrR family transcriptional regulator